MIDTQQHIVYILIGFFPPPQGDAGGVIGIIPLKGDRGFSGAPGLPVRLYP